MEQVHQAYRAVETPIRWLKDAVSLRAYLAQRDHFLATYGRPAYAPPERGPAPPAREEARGDPSAELRGYG